MTNRCAHFIKVYANFLKDALSRVKVFYLSLLGQLILSCNINIAGEILRAILIIARSETEDMTRNNEVTLCETYKIKMKSLLTSSNQEISIDDESEIASNIDVLDEENSNFNKWNQWAKNIDNDVQKKLLITKEIARMQILC